MTITVRPEAAVVLKERAEAEGISVEEYVERIALDEQKAWDELEALALEGINSGESVEGNDEYWESKIQRLREKYGTTVAK